MSTQANVAVKAVRKAVYDKVESQIHTFDAQVATLKAKAESAKAEAELSAIANLATAKGTLDQKVAELKSAGETAAERDCHVSCPSETRKSRSPNNAMRSSVRLLARRSTNVPGETAPRSTRCV